MEFQKDDFTLLDIWKVVVVRRVLIFSIAAIATLITFVTLTLLPETSKIKLLLTLPRSEKPLINFYEAKLLVDSLASELERNQPASENSDSIERDIEGIYVEPIAESDRQISLTIKIKNEKLKNESNNADKAVQFILTRLNSQNKVQEIENTEIRKFKLKIEEIKKITKQYDATVERAWKSMQQWKQIAFNPLEMDMTVGELKLLLIEEEEKIVQVKKFEMIGNPIYKGETSVYKRILFSIIAGIFGFFIAFFFSFAQAVERKQGDRKS